MYSTEIIICFVLISRGYKTLMYNEAYKSLNTRITRVKKRIHRQTVNYVNLRINLRRILLKMLTHSNLCICLYIFMAIYEERFTVCL